MSSAGPFSQHPALAAGAVSASGALFREDEPSWMGLPRATWLKTGTIAGLFVWLFFVPCLRRLWLKTNPISGEPNWGHSCIVPVIGIYYLYVNREQLLAAEVVPVLVRTWDRVRIFGAAGLFAVGSLVFGAGWAVSENLSTQQMGLMVKAFGTVLAGAGVLVLLLNWGLGTMIGGILLCAYGIYPGQNDYVKDLGMVVTLFGLVLYLCGWRIMRVAWFPIAYLICALPWPGLVYSWVAMPLQELAATVAVHVLQTVGVAAERVGTKIAFDAGNGVRRDLNVAEACAGMRSLMTFISLGAAIAFLSSRAFWQKLVIVCSAVPIAILCNVMRVSGTALLDRFWSQQWSTDFAHVFVGMVMMVPAFFMLLGVGWVLDKLFIEEADDDVKAAAAASAKGKGEELVITIPRRRAGGGGASGAEQGSGKENA